MSRSKKVGFAHKALLPTEDRKIKAIGFGDNKIPIGKIQLANNIQIIIGVKLNYQSFNQIQSSSNRFQRQHTSMIGLHNTHPRYNRSMVGRNSLDVASC